MKVLGATTALLLMFIVSSQSFVAGERDLRSQLMDFKTLIPQTKLRYIVNKHFCNDARFRHVIQYINTPEFDDVVQMVQHSSAYHQIIKYLQSAGVNTTRIEDISANIDALMSLFSGNAETVAKEDNIRANEENALSLFPGSGGAVAKEDNINMYEEYAYFSDESSEEVYDYYPGVSARSMQSFTNEIARSIPRKAFRHMVEEKMQVNQEFAKFYTAVSCKDFRRLVLNTVRSKELAEPLRILKKNGINARSQSLLALKVLSWGPRIH